MILLKTSIILLFFIVQSVYPMGNKVEIVPLKPRKPVITSGEMLKYTQYVGGEKNGSFYLVTISSNNQFVYQYIENEPEDTNKKLSDSLSDFHEIIKISIEEGSLAEIHANWLSNAMQDNWNGTAIIDFTVDRLHNQVIHQAKIWDGYELKTILNKVKIRPGFSIWNVDSLMYGMPRFMDISKPGIFYIVEPRGSKEAIPAYFVYLGKETVQTPAGTYNTVKLGFGIGDPFLQKLFQSYIKEWNFWIEDSERSLLIKADTQFGKYILEQIGRWKEAGQNSQK